MSHVCRECLQVCACSREPGVYVCVIYIFSCGGVRLSMCRVCLFFSWVDDRVCAPSTKQHQVVFLAESFNEESVSS